jgi:hypothetical protein
LHGALSQRFDLLAEPLAAPRLLLLRMQAYKKGVRFISPCRKMNLTPFGVGVSVVVGMPRLGVFMPELIVAL